MQFWALVSLTMKARRDLRWSSSLDIVARAARIMVADHTLGLVVIDFGPVITLAADVHISVGAGLHAMGEDSSGGGIGGMMDE